ncbi:MAG: cupin domain-containing protein [Candidatus Hydrothermarchaeaceae archaeon]
MKIRIKDFPEKARLVKSDERYDVYDLAMTHLVTSMTILHESQETTGHSHDDVEEVYLFLEGKGEIQLDDDRQNVEQGDLILIQKGVFHKVFNKGNDNLIFVSVFEQYAGRGK